MSADAISRLRSLLEVWYLDSPTWPPSAEIQHALRLLGEVETAITQREER